MTTEKQQTELDLTADELRALGTARGGALYGAIQKVLKAWRDTDRAVLLDPNTPHERTQYVRGRLALVADLVLLLEVEAPSRYQSERDRERNR